MPSVPWGVEFSKIFKKNRKIFKIPKMPTIVPKIIQTCFEHVLGKIFRKKICPVFHGMSSLRKFSKKNISKFQKCPKWFPKESKRVLIVIWGNFSEKILPSFPWKVESSKFFKKIKKFSKFQKRPKSFPKVSKRVLNKFWGKLFENFFPTFPWKVESSKIFKKIKQNFKIPKTPKMFPKESKRVLIVIWDNFSEKILPSFPWNVESSKIFKKKYFEIPKMPTIVPKSIQTCFEHVLGNFF